MSPEHAVMNADEPVSTPTRPAILPYGRQSISDEDIEAVVEVLRSDWLTTGPKVEEFEKAFAELVGARFAVAVSSGTAALHAAAYACRIGPGDEVIVPAMTFAASSNCVLYQGGTPVFADVERDTLLLDPRVVERKITSHTKAIIAVDYAGQPCDYDALQTIAETHGLVLIDDACHSVGGSYKGRRVGTLADLNTFSFHPVKHVTTGEGGMITTDDPALAERMRTFRNHGITTDHRQREQQGSWVYEMVDLGYNYRITDFQCALGISQIARLSERVYRRKEIARRYDKAFSAIPQIKPLAVHRDVSHAYHLYVIQLELERLSIGRQEIFKALRAEGLGVNVHYIPVHLHPFYRDRLGTGPGLCPNAEAAYERILSLPMFSGMSDDDIGRVVNTVTEVCVRFAQRN
jgi:perosamine synthetase